MQAQKRKHKRSLGFSVPFVKGQGRPRITPNGRGMYKPEDTRAAEAYVRSVFKTEAEAFQVNEGSIFPLPKDTPVQVNIFAVKPLAKAKKGGRLCHYLQKPDVDNMAKLVLDALNGVAYEDDRQVTELVVSKLPREEGQEERMMIQLFW